MSKSLSTIKHIPKDYLISGYNGPKLSLSAKAPKAFFFRRTPIVSMTQILAFVNRIKFRVQNILVEVFKIKSTIKAGE